MTQYTCRLVEEGITIEVPEDVAYVLKIRGCWEIGKMVYVFPMVGPITLYKYVGVTNVTDGEHISIYDVSSDLLLDDMAALYIAAGKPVAQCQKHVVPTIAGVHSKTLVPLSGTTFCYMTYGIDGRYHLMREDSNE